mmetsp:Transcript_1270/g.2794  ORF Transcript_1270/g.2794 Transcript_1270/m.2794 type:complete len:210 (-) Transcript_1270:448-1077(-)
MVVGRTRSRRQKGQVRSIRSGSKGGGWRIRQGGSGGGMVQGRSMMPHASGAPQTASQRRQDLLFTFQGRQVRIHESCLLCGGQTGFQSVQLSSALQTTLHELGQEQFFLGFRRGGGRRQMEARGRKVHRRMMCLFCWQLLLLSLLPRADRRSGRGRCFFLQIAMLALGQAFLEGCTARLFGFFQRTSAGVVLALLVFGSGHAQFLETLE